MKHKSKEFIINTPFVTSWRVVSPRLARCHLGAFDKIVKLNQGVCKGKEIAYLREDLPLVRQVLRGRWPWWDRQGCFFVDPSWVVASSWTLRGWSPPWTRATITLRGWSPPWTRATVTLRGLKSPSMWMYDSTTYRNHDKKICVSNCV